METFGETFWIARFLILGRAFPRCYNGTKTHAFPENPF